MSGVELVLFFFPTALASWVVVGAIHRFAVRRQILDRPNERSSHSIPTPRGGGLGIVAITLVATAVMYLARDGWTLLQFLAYFIGAALISAVSWLDDLRGVSATARFAVHAAVGMTTILAFGFWRVLSLPGIASVRLGGAGLFVTLLWLVGLTNAYNFMDGIDGIAGIQAIVAGAAYAAIAMRSHALIAFVAIVLAGSAAGFLWHNWPPATIFMGDVGSAFIGYSFATLAIAGSTNERSPAICYVLPIWPFIFDAVLTFIRRLLQRERVFEAHRSHLYQRLTQTGLSPATVGLIYGASAVVTSVFAVGIEYGWPGADQWGVPFAIAAAATLWLYTVVRERQLAQG